MDLDPAFTLKRIRIQGVKPDADPDPGQALALQNRGIVYKKNFFC
jgi:hypothetical protein